MLLCGLGSPLLSQSIRPVDLSLNGVEQLIMPHQDNKILKATELDAREPGRPYHFATPLAVNVNPDNHGTWETLDNGDLLWRLRILSETAKSLNLGFSRYEMPPEATMLLYSPDHATVMGPFSLSDNEDHAQFWSPIVKGEEIVIEVVVPVQRRNDLKLQLSSVNHDYMGFFAPASGSCNLDVICGLADGWGIVDPHRDIIQSAGMYTLNGIQTCSGALINNARNDCTPYFLTADHCGVSNGNAPSMVVYWNYENSTCRQPNSGPSGQNGNGQLNQFNSGAIFKAGYGPTDFTLVEMDDALDAQHNPFLAGWSREFAVPTSMIGVHHPGTEEKRISFDDDPGIISGWVSPTDSTHVEMMDWDVGTTEGGSSGSPLFNQDERIVGQLTGGGAACGNDLEDQYGWVRASWDGGGTPQSRLKDWLDPDNTGVEFIDGKSCAFSITPLPAGSNVCNNAVDSVTYQITVSGGFANNVTLTASNVPSMATATFSVNPVAPGATSTLTVGNLNNVSAGNYTFDVLGTDGVESDSIALQLDLDAAPPVAASLSLPANAATGITTFPAYSWTAIQASGYEIEVATDSLFANIIDNATGLAAPTYNGAGLQPLTRYFWRVRPDNSCGAGPWSMAFSFETANINCANIPATTVPVSIGSTVPNTITSTINISQTGTITDVNVLNVRGNHSYLGDLVFTLISPSGTAVNLISNACDSEQDFHISWDDQATGTAPCPYDDQMTYPPAGSLADFNGESPTGMWTLEVDDTEFQDGGSLNGWELDICATGAPLANDLGFAPISMTLYPNPSAGRVALQLTAPAQGDASIQVYSADGKWLKSQTLASGEQSLQLDTQDLAAGLYLVRVKANGQFLTQRLIIAQP